jgi:hypothetical protein
LQEVLLHLGISKAVEEQSKKFDASEKLESEAANLTAG